MKNFSMLICMLVSVAGAVSGQIQATLLGNWHDSSIVPTTAYNNPYNEVWGFAQNGMEYGIIGSTEAMHIIDVTNPAEPEELFRIPGASAGSHIIHRDFKTYNGFLFCVADEGSSSTLQVIDLNGLPGSATQVYSSNEFVTRAHNIFIDESQARLYAVGGGFSIKVLDISNPAQPSLLATYPNATLNIPGVHDAYVKDNIGFFNCGWAGSLWVVDFTDATNPQLLGTLSNYPEQGYNHSGWLSDDGQHYFMCDETHGTGIKSIDVSDFSDMEVKAVFQPDIWENEIPHNPIYRDGLLYVSYYYDGLQVFDVSNPENPIRVAYYDTAPLPNSTSYAGAWGVYPLLPSGNILVSDMQEGFFVFESLGDILDLSLQPSENQFETCAGEDVEFTLTIGDDYNAGGVSLSMTSNLPGASADFEPNPALPGETVAVTISNLSATQGSASQLVITADDGTNSNTANIWVTVDDVPGATPLVSPSPNAGSVPLQPLFDWDAASNAINYKLEIATDDVDFDGSIIYTNTTASTQLVPVNELDMVTQYFWRVTSQNLCGDTPSAIQSFTTESGTAVHPLEGNSFNVFPNPAKASLVLSFEKPVEERLKATLSSTTGQIVFKMEIPIGEKSVQMNTSLLPSGIYFLELAGGQKALVHRIVVQH